MTVKDHYTNHLADIYSWMVGDLSKNVDEFIQFLNAQDIKPSPSDIAADLGAGTGLQSIALAKLGFNVVAIDFNAQLLSELKSNTGEYNVSIINDDIRFVDAHISEAAIICCCGDTIAHLDSMKEIGEFVLKVYRSLRPGGKAILSFRDYSVPLEGIQRFIPVKTDADRILTCVLDYEDDVVQVTDLLYQRHGDHWEQKVSTYRKVRLRKEGLVEQMITAGFRMLADETKNRMIYLIGEK